MMALTRNQKRELVIKLHEDGKTYRDITEAVRISPRDINIILKEHYKEPEPEKPKSNRAKAFQMFTEAKDTIEVLQTLDLGYDEVRRYYGEYLTLKNMTEFIDFYRKNQRFLPFLLKVIEKLNHRELFENEADKLVDYLSHFHEFHTIKDQLQHEINCLLLKKKVLEDEILDENT
jgi:hypothetical protein